MAILGKGTFFGDPVGYLFGESSPTEAHPASAGSGQLLEPVKTTTVIGYVLLAGTAIYLTRKVFFK